MTDEEPSFKIKSSVEELHELCRAWQNRAVRRYSSESNLQLKVLPLSTVSQRSWENDSQVRFGGYRVLGPSLVVVMLGALNSNETPSKERIDTCRVWLAGEEGSDGSNEESGSNKGSERKHNLSKKHPFEEWDYIRWWSGMKL